MLRQEEENGLLHSDRFYVSQTDTERYQWNLVTHTVYYVIYPVEKVIHKTTNLLWKLIRDPEGQAAPSINLILWAPKLIDRIIQFELKWEPPESPYILPRIGQIIFTRNRKPGMKLKVNYEAKRVKKSKIE